jgi:DNA helicase-2/ATP-dependent DNA helicase PcrA
MKQEKVKSMKLKLLGPPGTGKTSKLLEYFEMELQSGVAPNRIAFLTFTRAARIEALQRTGRHETDFPYLKTIHSICYHQLNVGKDQIARPDNLRSFGYKIGIKMTGNELDPWIEEFERGNDAPTRDDFLIQANHRGRHRKQHLKEALDGVSLDVDYKYALWFTKAYRSWKDTEGLMDYTDLLSSYIENGRPLDVDVIFVDEAQDLSALQWEVVSILGANAKRWYVAGDDDQAIFTWAGADPHVFQDFQADKTEVLAQSYRCSKAVYRAAMGIAGRIKTRLEKNYAPTQSEGEVKEAGYLTTLDFSHKTFILFRNHYRGAEIARTLRGENIPFIGKGSPLLNVDIRAALFAWMSFVKSGEAKSDSVKRMIRYVSPDYLRGDVAKVIKEKVIVKSTDIFVRKPTMGEWSLAFTNLPSKDHIASYIEKYGLQRTAVPKIELMSIHQSKGRQAHTVVIDPEMSRAVWSSMIKTPDDEHRVWYVGVTRAQERVFYLLPDGNLSYQF